MRLSSLCLQALEKDTPYSTVSVLFFCSCACAIAFASRTWRDKGRVSERELARPIFIPYIALLPFFYSC